MNRLKELRQEKKLTQKEVADAVGVSKRTYIYWENGESQIKPEKAQQLADFFGVSVGYLLGYDDFVDSLIEKVKKLKEYRCLKVGSDIYISEQDVMELLMSYNRQESNHGN